ncbi:MAG: plastocyanin/azurin family copper-binding protein [Acidimicrobiia bacterium]|nr:plastocyanin/azurin family copper-binding protein [Acidimicrobiia bacterium]
MRRRWVSAAAAAAACALLVGACGGDDSGDGASSDKVPVPTEDAVNETESTEVAVAATDNVFNPETVTVSAGTTITWANGGRNDHNIVDASEGWTDADPAPFEVDAVAFTPGDEYTFTVDEPGTYAYYCSLHGTPTGGMIGTVIVE